MSVSEWDYREVCPDGSCIGIIGDDGVCKVCGRAAPNWGDERKRGMIAAEADADAGEADDKTAAYAAGDDEADDGGADEDEEEAALASNGSSSGEGGDDWSKRVLCANGACVGVIGADGRCNVCGSAPE